MLTTEHALGRTSSLLKRFHGLAEIVERGTGVPVEGHRVIHPYPEREILTIAENASRRGYRFAQQCLGFFEALQLKKTPRVVVGSSDTTWTSGLARVARFVRTRAETDSDAIDATLSTQVLPRPGACAGNFTFAGREDDGDVKLHAATVAESITNWPEVVAKLRGTRFEKYLTMDGSVLP